MANESRIKFSLFSTFSGKGFQEAQQGIEATSKTVDKAHRAVGQLAGQLEQLPGPAGKATSAVFGLARAGKELGVLGVVMAGAGVAMNYFTQKLEEAEALAEKTS